MVTRKITSARVAEIKLEKAKRYIAYMDILGFREMLSSPNFESDVTDIVRILQERISRDDKIFPNLRYLAVSDTIVIAEKSGEGHLLCRKVGQVQNALLRLGFAVRGAISFGEVFTHETDRGWNIFGKTYVSAYEAEQSLAVYPRVVIDRSCGEQLKDDIRNSSHRRISTYILRDADGFQFVNQFSSDVIGLSSESEKNREVARRNREQFRDKKAEALKKTIPLPKAYMKWRWLMQQLKNQLDS